MIRRTSPVLLTVALCLVALACGKDGPSSPTGPSPTTPTTPATVNHVTVFGVIKNSESGQPVVGARVTATGGSSTTGTTTTDGNGYYSIPGIAEGSVSLQISADRYTGKTERITASGQQFDTTLVPYFHRAGSGASVFDMPTTVSRVRIVGTYNGRCENFIVHIGGEHIVNEILGTCSVATTGSRHEGTYLTRGGVVEVLNSSGIAWEFWQEQ